MKDFIVYESETMTVADSRNLISPERAYDLLIAGGKINICNPPDYSAENECDIFDFGVDANWEYFNEQWEFYGLSEIEKKQKFILWAASSDLFEVADNSKKTQNETCKI